MWHVTHDMWNVTCDTWHLTYDTGHLTSDIWHLTSDTWHMTCVKWHTWGDEYPVKKPLFTPWYSGLSRLSLWFDSSVKSLRASLGLSIGDSFSTLAFGFFTVAFILPWWPEVRKDVEHDLTAPGRLPAGAGEVLRCHIGQTQAAVWQILIWTTKKTGSQHFFFNTGFGHQQAHPA